MNTLHDYEISIQWSEEDECYIARIREIPFCSAHGETLEEAAHNLSEAFNFYCEIASDKGIELPAPKNKKEISIEQLKKAKSILNVTKLAQESGIAPETLRSLIKRPTSKKLKETENKKLQKTMKKYGVALR
tara:strand:- start:69968 stop:70363 length:396 start_codon:yes stop_codon:yes gene_type:complete